MFGCQGGNSFRSGTETTGIVSGLTYTGITAGDLRVGNLTYTYDNLGNIKTVKEGTELKESYVYDSLNQLIRHNSVTQNKTIVYTYDAGGNLLNRKEYAYTTEADLSALTPETTVPYTYGDTSWKDKLTAYDGQSIAYDAIGNPITYHGWSNTWQGRQLASTSQGGMTLSFKYNVDGIRTQKTVNGTATDYFLNGNKILAQKTGSTVTWFYYDQQGTRVAMEHGGKLYYYLYNLQGDVIALCDASSKQIVAKYSYDAWGKLLTKENLGTGTLADVNPFRYRGYYYDAETGMYYLNSRYYDPETGRFLNLDSILDNRGVNTLNLFAYCGNNPVKNQDSNGKFFFGALVGGIIGGAAGAITALVKGKSVRAGALTGAATGAAIGLVCDIVATGGMSAVVGAALCGIAAGVGNAVNQYANYRIEKKEQTQNKKPRGDLQKRSSNNPQIPTSSNGKLASECDSFADYVDVKSIAVSSVSAIVVAPMSIGANYVVNSAFAGVETTGITGFATQFAANFAMGGNIFILQSIIDLF